MNLIKYLVIFFIFSLISFNISIAKSTETDEELKAKKMNNCIELYLQDKYDEGIKSIDKFEGDKSIKSDPIAMGFLTDLRGSILIAMGKYNDGMDCFDKVLEMKKTDEAHEVLRLVTAQLKVNALYGNGQKDEANKYYNEMKKSYSGLEWKINGDLKAIWSEILTPAP